MATIYFSQLDAFELYHQVREENEKSNSSATSQHLLRSIGDGMTGSAGSAISNLILYPLDLIITRLQVQRQLRKNANEANEGEYKGLVDAAQKIYNNEGGLKGFYAGILSDTGKTIADSFFFFLMYDYLRRSRLRKGGVERKSLPALEELGVGFVAGAITKLLTTPIANVAKRQQSAALSKPGQQTPTAQEIIQNIRDEDGIKGFWSGYSASLILTLNPSLTFFLYELLKRVTLPRSKRDHPPPTMTFLLAATSKACASTVTYPFSLAKSRLQAGSPKRESEDEDKSIKENVHSSNTKVEKAERKAARHTVISTLLTIYSNEGLPALYEGVHLEILKAFLSHGITMSVKQLLTRVFGRVAYTLGLILSRYQRRATRQASRLAERAKDTSVGYYDLSIKRVNERVQSAVDEAKGKAHEVAEMVNEYVDEADISGNGGEWRDLYGATGLASWLDNRFKDGGDGQK